MLKRVLPIAAAFLAAVLGFGSAPGMSSGVPQRVPSDYSLVELPTLGGTQDFANFINDRGWVAGAADLAGGQSEHAFLWRGGQMLDLGTLGGTNSLAWPVNDFGEVGGTSDTSTADPLLENFCHFNIDGVNEFTDRTCLAFTWLRGVTITLPTLGGNNSQVFGINALGQVVGVAENATQDPACVAPQVLDWKPVVWGPDRRVRDLKLYPGDTVGAAIAINDRGQIVGGSGLCAPVSPSASAHALLWQDGSPTYLGGFGGVMNNAPFDVNNRGQVVGFSDLPGDTTTHAFLWQRGVMTDLGTLPGDFASFAFGINDGGEVVGQSCDVNFNCRAFMWQHGVMTDLNTLIDPPSALYLMLGESINAGGVITGIAFDQSTGGVPAFVAIPTMGRGIHLVSRINLPANVRRRFQLRSATTR